MVLVAGVHGHTHHFLGGEQHESPHDICLLLCDLLPLHDLLHLVGTPDFKHDTILTPNNLEFRYQVHVLLSELLSQEGLLD